MSMETWAEDWKSLGDEVEEKRIKDENKLEVLEKFFERVKDVVLAYEDEEKYEDIIEDIKWEIDNVEVEL